MGYARVQYHDEWIVENYLNYPSYGALADAHNQLFGTQMVACSMKNHCRVKLGIRKAERHRPFTHTQIEWLIENYPKLGVRKAHEMFNKHFNENRTLSSVRQFGTQHGICVDKNIATENKLIYGARRKGSKRALREIGSVRYADGRPVIKTKNGWEIAARVIWEKHNGKIPKDYVIIHLDNNTNNYAIENLACVPLRHLTILLGNDMKSPNKDITKTALKWCELRDLIESEVKRNENVSCNRRRNS